MSSKILKVKMVNWSTTTTANAQAKPALATNQKIMGLECSSLGSGTPIKSLGTRLHFYTVAGNTPSDFSRLAQVKARDLTLLSLPLRSKSTRAGGDFHLQLYRIQSSLNVLHLN